mmetsp:Transcript_5061/g.16202  ORF Transcript_5061/g.16202 Transcript_5061/m.16202 type:complete len:332 (-) Transcript_5061:42-1037(-)
MISHCCLIQSSSIFKSTSQSSSFVISTFVWFSPFLYSKVQSSNKILGFSIFLNILPGKHTSLFIMTPFKTVESSIAPPGIFSTFANFLISISADLPSGPTVFTVCTASKAKFGTKSPNLAVNFVPTLDLTIFNNSSLFSTSNGNAIFASIISTAFSNAFENALAITVGCTSFSKNGMERCKISPAKIITLVVPSPTSSSWLLASSIIDFAAGCVTSISLKIAFPSFVITMPPEASRIIFNIDRGPNVVRTTSDTAFAADMFCIWAFLPVSRRALTCNTCILMSRRSAALTFEFHWMCDDFSLTLSDSVKNEGTFKTKKTKKRSLKKSASLF